MVKNWVEFLATQPISAI